MGLGEQLGEFKEHVQDGFRGRPDVDLASYAKARGLDHRGQMAQAGYLTAFPMTADLQFNVLRGELPGGQHGVLFHEVKLHEADLTRGTFYGHSVGGDMKAQDLAAVLPLVGEHYRYFKAPYTIAAIRIPEASGPIVALDVGRGGERVIDAPLPGTDKGVRAGLTLDLSFLTRKKKPKPEPENEGPQPWAGYALDAWALPDWRVAWRGRARQEVVEELIAGPVAQMLAEERPLGFRATFARGTLTVVRQHFLKSDEELDAHATVASSLASEIRRICVERAEFQPFGTELPPPDWAQAIDDNPGDEFGGIDGQDLARAAGVCRERELASEDPFAFHRAFGDISVPGEAIGVFRGTLPGTSVHGRLVTAIERPLYPPPPDWDRVVDELPHGSFGCDSVLFEVKEGTPDEHPDAGEPWGELSRYAIRRGVFAAWRPRNAPHTDGGELDALAAEAVAFAGERGLI